MAKGTSVSAGCTYSHPPHIRGRAFPGKAVVLLGSPWHPPSCCFVQIPWTESRLPGMLMGMPGREPVGFCAL